MIFNCRNTKPAIKKAFYSRINYILFPSNDLKISSKKFISIKEGKMKTKKRRSECDEKSRETGSVNEPEQKKISFFNYDFVI